MGGGTLLLFFPPPPAPPAGGLTGNAPPASLVGPFGWSFLFPSAAPTPYADLLSCLVAYLENSAGVLAALGNPNVYSLFGRAADATGNVYPFLLVSGYDEMLPGESLEDREIRAEVCEHANDLNQCRSVAAAVKAALDLPNYNPASAGRALFAWQGAAEVYSYRDDSKPRRVPALTRGNAGTPKPYAYAEAITYRFFCAPEV